MSDLEKRELLPCPFCGGEAASEYAGGSGYTVFCDGCHASAATELFREKAIAAWNTRTPSTPGTRVEGLEEAARVAEDHVSDAPIGIAARVASTTSTKIAAAIRALKHPTGREG